MEAKDWIAIGSAVVSGVFALLSGLAAKSSRKTATGQAETGLRAQISLSRRAVRDIGIQIATVREGKSDADLSPEQKRRLEPLALAFMEAVEDNLNAYEDACGKYRDNKIDKERFKKTYVNEIRNICEDKTGPTSGLMFPEAPSRFQCIWAVYKEWHHHEK